jgi:hypothetical protein
VDTYCISKNAIRQAIGDESVILNLDNGQYYGLDEIGTRMLELLEEHGDIDTVVNTLAEEYDTERERIRADLQQLLGELQDQGIVQRGLGESQ